MRPSPHLRGTVGSAQAGTLSVMQRRAIMAQLYQDCSGNAACFVDSLVDTPEAAIEALVKQLSSKLSSLRDEPKGRT